MRFEGIYTPLVTPHHDDFTCNEAALEATVVPLTIHDVALDDPKAREEIFGPILSVIEVASTEHAIALANDTKYGLVAAVFTGATGQALRAARDVRAGAVTMKRRGEDDISTPFAGYKASGFGGRDNGLHARDQYTELKPIWVDLTDPADQERQ
jgi:gamma-glutamyl-gamma-aminobutyraldehyde dehydrogenase